jgi:hypothetical protein
VELGTTQRLARQGRLMAAVTQVYALDHVAKMLAEDLEMLEAIVSNDDNLSYGNIISVHTGTDQAVTVLTHHSIEELRDMLRDARRTPQDWDDFLEYFVAEPDLIARVKGKGPR